jgi:hypothetical protein
MSRQGFDTVSKRRTVNHQQPTLGWHGLGLLAGFPQSALLGKEFGGGEFINFT